MPAVECEFESLFTAAGDCSLQKGQHVKLINIFILMELSLNEQTLYKTIAIGAKHNCKIL